MEEGMNGDCEEKGEYKKRVKGGRGSVTSGGCVKGRGGGQGGFPPRSHRILWPV